MRFLLPLLATLTMACGAAPTPPMIADEDGGTQQEQANEPPANPCDTPAANCPCTDIGTQVSCGLVYRISGGHTDCSPGYLTCQDDGKWSACIGDAIWDGG